MSILVDASQVIHAAVANEIKRTKMQTVDEAFLRHLIINHLRSFNMRFREQYGTMVLVFDGGHYWRKDFFPLYKQHRKKHREEKLLDWKQIFETVGKIKDEIIEARLFPTIVVDDAEADDTIAILTHLFAKTLNQKVLIMSSDKDYRQLQYLGSNVKQYSPIMKEFLVEKDPAGYLLEHIICGDKGDGVPNVLSADDCFLMNVKQTAVTKKRWEELTDIVSVQHLNSGYHVQIKTDGTDPELVRRILRNYTCVCMANENHIPEKFDGPRLKKDVLSKMMKLQQDFVYPSGTQIFGFLASKGLKQLSGNLEDLMVSQTWAGSDKAIEVAAKRAKTKKTHEAKQVDSFLDSLASGQPQESNLDAFFT